MKINGIQVKAPETKVLVIPMDETKFVVRAKYVENFDEFNKIYPEPEPPTIVKNGASFKDFKDKEYLEAVNTHLRAQIDWLYLTSLSATEGLTWETVDMADPTTWSNWRTELTTAGFPLLYVSKITALVDEVNGFDVRKLDEATESFLAMIPEEQKI